MKAFVFSFAQMGAFSAISEAMATLQSTLGAIGTAIKATVHGIIGGALSIAQGGSYLQGFAGSSIGAIGGAIAGESGLVGQYRDGNAANMLARALISGAAGCVGAVVTGGKCAQAAVTAAFASMYNGDAKRTWGGYFCSFSQSCQEVRAWSLMNEFHNALLPGTEQDKRTTAVLVAWSDRSDTLFNDGPGYRLVVASSHSYLSSLQKQIQVAEDVFVANDEDRSAKHAEMRAVDYAERRGWSPLFISISRIPCEDGCYPYLAARGLTTPRIPGTASGR